MSDEGKEFLNPDEIDALLNSAGEGSKEGPDKMSSQDDGTSAPDGDTPSEDVLDPQEIERLLQERDAAREQQSTAPEQAGDGDPEDTLDEAEAHLGEALSDSIDMPDPVAQFGSPAPFTFEPFDGSPSSSQGKQPLQILQDVELDLRIELGRTEMLIEEVVELKEGSVVTLDKLAGDPVDILVNGRLIAKGEVLVLNDNFCVRVAEILTPDF